MQWLFTRPALRESVMTVLLVLPWINPFAGGPSPAVIPWLVSVACLSVWLLAASWWRPDAVRCVARAWLVAALLSSVIGLLQFFGISETFKPWINVTALGDAFGNMRQRNQFATLIGIGLVVLLWGPMAGRAGGAGRAGRAGGAGWSDWLQRVRPSPSGSAAVAHAVSVLPVLVALVLLSSVNAVTSSRTGLLQMVLLLLLAICWRAAPARPAMALRLGVVFAAYATASVVLPLLAGLDPWSSGIAGRFGESDRACGSRRFLWANVLHLIAQKPWRGWGWGELDFGHFITIYPGARFCDILDNAHNLPLHLAVELGVPVALLVCGLLGWLVLRARPWRETDDNRRMAWAVLALIGLHSLLEYPLWYGPFQIAVVLSVWILWRTPARRDQGVQPVGAGLPDVASQPLMSAPIAASRVGAGGAIVVLCVVAYAAWDYHRVSQIYRAPEQRASAYRDDTLVKIRGSWLFNRQVRFAELTLTGVTAANAASINRSARALLHFSPEARVVEKLIDSALVLGRQEEAVYFMRRMRIAYPEEYAHWRDTREPVAELPVIDP